MFSQVASDFFGGGNPQILPAILISFMILCAGYASSENTIIQDVDPFAARIETIKNECVLKSEHFGRTFDFTSLGEEIYTSNTIVDLRNRSHILQVSICSNERLPCGDSTDATACYDNKQVLGNDYTLSLENGAFWIRTTGPTCYDGTPQSLNIRLICDHNDPDQGPFELHRFVDDCHGHSTLRTEIACYHAGMSGVLDMFSTIRADLKVTETHVPLHTKKERRLSFCNFLDLDKGVPCRDEINVCLAMNQGTKSQITPMHSVKPYISTTDPMRNYYYVEFERPMNPIKKQMVRARFDCYPNATHSVPKPLNGKSSKCDITISFRAPLQCPYRCKMIHPQLDFNALSDEIYRVEDGNYVYELFICDSHSHSHYAYRYRRYHPSERVSIGSYSEIITYIPERQTAQLTYKTAEPCGGSEVVTTIVNLICDHPNGNGPLMKNKKMSTECRHVFDFRTHLACTHQRVSCKIETAQGETLDLSGLRVTIATVSTKLKRQYGFSTFYVAPCGVIDHKDIECRPGTGICEKGSDEWYSLGTPKKNLFMDNGKLVMENEMGDECDGHTRHSSRIEFKCDPRGGHGRPVLMSVHKCVYVFEWRTNVVCPKQPLEFDYLHYAFKLEQHSGDKLLALDCDFQEQEKPLPVEQEIISRLNSVEPQSESESEIEELPSENEEPESQSSSENVEKVPNTGEIQLLNGDKNRIRNLCNSRNLKAEIDFREQKILGEFQMFNDVCFKNNIFKVNLNLVCVPSDEPLPADTLDYKHIASEVLCEHLKGTVPEVPEYVSHYPELDIATEEPNVSPFTMTPIPETEAETCIYWCKFYTFCREYFLPLLDDFLVHVDEYPVVVSIIIGIIVIVIFYLKRAAILNILRKVWK